MSKLNVSRTCNQNNNLTGRESMKNHIIGNPLRITFSFMATLIWLGIMLTGINAVHWVLFLPAAFLTFAGVTGICPGLIMNKIILKEN